MASRRFNIKMVSTWQDDGFVRIPRSDTEWWQVPERMTVMVEVEGGYEAELRTELDAGSSPTITKIVIEREPDGPPLADLIRGPWEKVLAQAVERAAVRWEFDTDRGEWFSRFGHGVPGAAGIAIKRGRRSDQQQADMEREIQQVMELWPEAQQHPAPIEFLRGRLGLSRRTTQRRVQAALDRMSQEES